MKEMKNYALLQVVNAREYCNSAISWRVLEAEGQEVRINVTEIPISALS